MSIDRDQLQRLATLKALGISASDMASAVLAHAIASWLAANGFPVNEALILGGIDAVRKFAGEMHPDKISAPGVDVAGVPVERE